MPSNSSKNKRKDLSLYTNSDKKEIEFVENVFNKSNEPFNEKIDSFSKFASKKSIARFLVLHEIFKKIINLNGSIIECGVLNGASLFAFAKFSSIYEPANYSRKIIGFDTFEGYPISHENDISENMSENLKEGMLKGSTFKNILDAIDLYDINRPLGHIPKVEIVKGNIVKTAPDFVRKNGHLLISLLYLDTDTYEATKVALDSFLPLMPKGAIIVFDELNTDKYPGETKAFKEFFKVRDFELTRFPIEPLLSFMEIK